MQEKDAPYRVSMMQEEDLTQRVFVPIERRNMNGTLSLRTLDGERYIRTRDGSIRRVVPKVNGKEAKRLRRACQRS